MAPKKHSKKKFQTMFVTNDVMLKHSPKVEYESAERLSAQLDHFHIEGLDLRWVSCTNQGREATEDELALAHEREYINAISNITEKSTSVSATRQSPHASKPKGLGNSKAETNALDFIELRRPFAKNVFALHDCVFNKYTYTAAKIAAGSVLEAITWVTELSRKRMAGGIETEEEATQSKHESDFRNAFAAVRPPGHHACSGFFGGFCYINQVAVAALYARKVLGLERVVIIDWDVHHGDGTENIILNKGDKGILFFSLHRYGNGFFPGSGEVTSEDVIEKNGWQRVVNIPLIPILETVHGELEADGSFGNREYLEVFRQSIIPIMQKAFNGKKPQLILVSSGFDAAEGDLLGGFLLTPGGYAAMLSILCRTAENGHVVVSTEGGYTPHVNALCAGACMRTLLQHGQYGCCTTVQDGASPDSIPDIDSVELQLFPFIDEGSKERTQQAIREVNAFHLGENPLMEQETVERGEQQDVEGLKDSMERFTLQSPTSSTQTHSSHTTTTVLNPPPTPSKTPLNEFHTPTASGAPSRILADCSNIYTTPLVNQHKSSRKEGMETRSVTRRRAQEKNEHTEVFTANDNTVK